MDSFARATATVSLEQEMKRSYLDYAMSVIVGRALPDVRDGLKPVHRRVLYAMYELKNEWNRPYKKSARVVGDVIGKYHPHGDTAVYDAIVRLAQPFSLRYMLVDGQGNFGSIDGDNAAAMRYTEIRMAKIGHALLENIEKETVDFLPNYDGSEYEPSVLPASLPNLLINGSSGIAVGMATNIPPHNLREVVQACLLLLHDPDASVDSLIEIINAPDFPTAGLIHGVSGAREAYRTGRGKVIMRARTHNEPLEKGGGRCALIIDELPYQVNKKALLERIAALCNEKKLEGISDIRDESDKSGMRVVIELKRGIISEVVLNNLYKLTQMQDTFGINMVALVEGRPCLLNLKQVIGYFLRHRREVIARRTTFDLRKAKLRLHILEGLAVALANIDEVIELIRSSGSRSEAHTRLLARAWSASLVLSLLDAADARDLFVADRALSSGLTADGQYRLSEMQVKAILDMQLARLTGLERDKITGEYQDLVATILDLLDILSRPERVTQIIDEELKELSQTFGDARRSEIVGASADLDMEDLIASQNMVVTLSHAGYIKAQPLSDYRAQRRGGRGKQAVVAREEDFIEHLFIANTHNYILCFSTLGRCFWLKVYELPQGQRAAKGRPIVNFFPLAKGEKITTILPVTEFSGDRFIFMATRAGVVKKTALSHFSNPRKTGIIAINLDAGDHLVRASLTQGDDDIMLFSDQGKAVRFSEADVRDVGRSARGVRGMQLESGAAIIAMLVAPVPNDEWSVLTATKNGYGKRTAVKNYTRHGRGTKGMIAIQCSDRNGLVVAAELVRKDDDVMLISDNGVMIRMAVDQIRRMSRVTQGVTLIALEEKAQLVGLQKVVEADVESEID